jgi:hypothetical protein
MSCSGRGEIYEPDAIQSTTNRKAVSKPAAKKPSTGSGVWKLFAPSPPTPKKPKVDKSSLVKKQNKKKLTNAAQQANSAQKAPPIPDEIKWFAAIVAVIGAIVISEQTTNIGAPILGGIFIFALTAATLVIINRILDAAVEILKKVFVIAFWGLVVFVVVYAIGK